MRNLDDSSDTDEQADGGPRTDCRVSSFSVPSGTVFYDAQNEHRWIQSDVAVPLSDVA